MKFDDLDKKMRVFETANDLWLLDILKGKFDKYFIEVALIHIFMKL